MLKYFTVKILEKKDYIRTLLSTNSLPYNIPRSRLCYTRADDFLIVSFCTDGRAMRSQQLNLAVGRQSSPGLGFVGSNGGDLSPTSNQLARWFSPELLAQARAGKLPELGQTNVLSLEELERLQHASTIVHN